MKRAFIATIIAVLFVHMVSAQTVVLLETFEGTFPQNNGWTVGGNATWAKVTNGFGNHVAASGNAFAYCAAIGNAGTPQNPVYPSSMNGYMGRAINLTGNATATLSFWYMIPSIEECFHIFGRCDYFSVQIDGQEIYFDENPSLSWMPVSINLRPYGMTNHVVSFQFVSNGSFNHEGAYLDHIVILGQKTLLPNVLVNNPNADATSRNTQSEPSIVLGDGGTVLAAYNDSGSLNVATSKFTGWAVSTNGGQSFQDMGTLPSGVLGDGGDPVLARDTESGVVYLTTLVNPIGSRLQLFRSLDNGRTFQAPINAAPGFGGGDSLDKPWLAVDNQPGLGRGNVYLAFRDFPSGQPESQQSAIYFNVSTNQGLTWGTPLLIGAGGQGAYVVVGPQHEVYVFWLSGQRILMSKSRDNGQAFNLAVTVASITSTNSNGDLGLNIRTDSFPRAAVNPATGDLYVVYNDKGVLDGDGADIFFTKSSDSGASWSPRVRVNKDFSTHSQWFPCISVSPDGHNLFIAWYDRRLEGSNIEANTTFGVFGTIAGTNVLFGLDFRIGDALFAPPTNVDMSVSTYLGDYIQAVADEQNFYFAWGDARSGNADVRLARIPIPDRFARFEVSQGTIRLVLNTNPLGNYTVQSSSDLGNWTTLTNFVAGDFTFEMIERDPVANSRRFYRAFVR